MEIDSQTQHFTCYVVFESTTFPQHLGFYIVCIALEQDISDFVGSLPHSPDKLPMIILRSRNETNPKKFKANGKHILEALDWLKDNNEFYEKIPIDREAALQHYNPNHFIEGIPEEFVEDPINTDEPQNPTMINEDGDEIIVWW